MAVHFACSTKFFLTNCQETALSMKMCSQYWDASIVQEIIECVKFSEKIQTNVANSALHRLNIDYLIAEKWSGQNWTSQTGSATPVLDGRDDLMWYALFGTMGDSHFRGYSSCTVP